MKRLTGRAALAEWPGRLAAVQAEPTDSNLQRLCNLLDTIDRWIVQRWGTAGHVERLSALASFRAVARQANQLVSAASRETGRRRAQQTNRKRAVSRASDVAGAVPRPKPVQDTPDGPAAA